MCSPVLKEVAIGLTRARPDPINSIQPVSTNLSPLSRDNSSLMVYHAILECDAMRQVYTMRLEMMIEDEKKNKDEIKRDTRYPPYPRACLIYFFFIFIFILFFPPNPGACNCNHKPQPSTINHFSFFFFFFCQQTSSKTQLALSFSLELHPVKLVLSREEARDPC